MPNLWWVARLFWFFPRHMIQEIKTGVVMSFMTQLWESYCHFSVPHYLFSCRRSLQRAVKTRRWGSLAILEAYYHYEPEVLLFVEVLTVSKNSFSLHKTYIVLCGSKDDFSRFLPLMWVYKVNLVLWITFLFLLKNCRVSNWKNDNLKM